MKKYFAIIAVISALALSGCSANSDSSVASGSGVTSDNSVTSSTSSTSDSVVPDVSQAEQDGAAAATAEQSQPSETAETEITGTPLTGADILDGSYEITVDSSSTMFNITKCTLNVYDGEMTAVMTMHGKGYLYVFMGKGDDAVESGYIPFVEDADGAHTFTVPVEALDTPVDCAAFSKNKEKWYDRTLVFRSDNIPSDCFADGVVKTAASLGLADGEYTVDVTLSGGSGKATVQSPAKLTVSGGNAEAEIVWSSPNYDYMRIGEEKFLPVNSEGNSTFVIPVSCFDREITVYADTIAMSEPHEIEYVLVFDSASVK